MMNKHYFIYAEITQFIILSWGIVMEILFLGMANLSIFFKSNDIYAIPMSGIIFFSSALSSAICNIIGLRIERISSNYIIFIAIQPLIYYAIARISYFIIINKKAKNSSLCGN